MPKPVSCAGLDDIRIGQGYDVHAFGPGDHVILGGVKIAHSHGLVGHSDADVLIHAIVDALYGALAEADIGAHFPPSDPTWKGAASDVFLRHAVGRVRARGGMIAHIDATLVCEAPKLSPHREAIRARLAEIAGLPLGRVAVKATTSEGLGFTGRREGIAALALATVRLPGSVHVTKRSKGKTHGRKQHESRSARCSTMNCSSQADRLIALYRRRNLMLTTAESCTGGLVAALLTEIAGSSAVVERGFVTYSNAAKEELLGVAPALLAAHGAVSAPVACAMAQGALEHSRTNVAVAITGIAGPGRRNTGEARRPRLFRYGQQGWRRAYARTALWCARAGPHTPRLRRRCARIVTGAGRLKGKAAHR